MGDSKKEKEQFEYLFLDIEWNQTPGTKNIDGREAIQIALVAANAEMQKEKTFSKAIRLSNPDLFNTESAKISHTSLTNIMQGKAEDMVLMKFTQSFPEYRYIVVWTRDTYELFKRDMRKYGLPMKRHKVVVLQEILGMIAGNGNSRIGFEKALTCSGIAYVSSNLHYAKHDADYLYQLFRQCWRRYSDMTAGEACIANTRTGKMHTKDCRYGQMVLLERKQLVPKSFLFKGFTVCKCCGKKQVWKRLEWKPESSYKVHNKRDRDDLKQLPLTEENIEKMCKWFQFSYSISNDTVFIRTAYARWILYLREGKVEKLLHENYRISNSQYCKKQKMKCTEGYHKQKLPSEKFFEVLQYIKVHDTGIIKKMTKKSRLEKLLEMVEMELELGNSKAILYDRH